MKPGGKNNDEIPGKSIQVSYFENRSNLASSSASIVLTEGIRDVVLSQSKMELVNEKGEWVLEGVITDYRISPISIQAGSEVAAQNRLTMSVSFSWEYINADELDEESTLVTEGQSTLSAFVDYDSSQDFASAESDLLTELVRQLSQDIYDKVFGGKW